MWPKLYQSSFISRTCQESKGFEPQTEPRKQKTCQSGTISHLCEYFCLKSKVEPPIGFKLAKYRKGLVIMVSLLFQERQQRPLPSQLRCLDLNVVKTLQIKSRHQELSKTMGFEPQTESKKQETYQPGNRPFL